MIFIHFGTFFFLQLISRRLIDAEGLVPAEVFYIYLTVWVSNDPLGYAASQANFCPRPREWIYDKYDTTGENLRSKWITFVEDMFILWSKVNVILITLCFLLQSRRQSLWSSPSFPSTSMVFVRRVTLWRPLRVCGPSVTSLAERESSTTLTDTHSCSGSSTSGLDIGFCWPSAWFWPALSWSVPFSCSTLGLLASL